MFRYIVRRVLLIVPTVLIILLFTFWLQSLAPGDQIEAQLTLEGESSQVGRSNYMDSYKALQKERGLDLPLFFFGVQPSYFPDTLHKIIPKQKRVLLTSLLRQTKDWTTVSAYEVGLQSLMSNLLASDDDVKKIRIELSKIEQAKSLSDIKTRCQNLKTIAEDSNYKNETLEQLFSRVASMKTSTVLSYPRLQWHGWNNQFNRWLGRIFNKEENVSLQDGTPVIDKIGKALKWTISMSAITLVLVAIFSLLLGYYKAYYRYRWFDKISSSILYVLLAVPTFWFASLMVIFFTTPEYGSWTDIFPSIGIKPSFVVRSFWAELMDNVGQLVLPITCMTIMSLSYLTIQLRSDILNTLSRPYMMMARAKGLDEKQVLRNHALPNALLPYFTILTGSIPAIFTGSVIIEVIFNIPGIGRLLLSAVQEADWPVVFTIVIIISFATMVGYLVGDILLVKLFPKTRDSLGLENAAN